MTDILTLALGEARVGFRGRISALDMSRADGAGLPAPELERRLIELGFVEGADVGIAAPGPVRRRSDRCPRGCDHDCAAPARGHGDCGGAAMNASVELAADRCARRQSQLRQDGAVQRADRQPPEGRELSGRHRRKEQGRLSTAGGRSVQLLDLPGTYSLRARSPDEEITRDAVLGKLASETPPDLIVCVGDAPTSASRCVLRSN